MEGKYTHGEAFMLMVYKCKSCGKEELLWNSRDGVTPFGIDCLACGEDSYHINWQQDERAPDFADRMAVEGKFQRMRVFVDARMHHEHIQRGAREYVEKHWDAGLGEVMAPLSKEATIGYYIRDWTKEGSPTVVSAVTYLADRQEAMESMKRVEYLFQKGDSDANQ